MPTPLTGGHRLLSENPGLFPHVARQVGTDASTVWRFANRGCRLPDGGTLLLETTEVGGRRLTSADAVRRYTAARDAARPVKRRTAAE
jgi:hypothetical protein